jgi:hypothetical protein
VNPKRALFKASTAKDADEREPFGILELNGNRCTKDTMVTRRGTKKIATVGRAQIQVCSPEEGLKLARLQVFAAMPEIIEAFVEEAKGGSCQHAKFLMEFAVEEPAEENGSTAEVADPEEESLASILLRELRESEARPENAG